MFLVLDDVTRCPSEFAEWSTQLAEGCSDGLCRSNLSEVYVKPSSCPSSCWGSRKRAALILSNSKSARWTKIGNIHLESCSQIFGETRRIRTQSSSQGADEETMNGVDSGDGYTAGLR